jgi:hypothetical protein
VIVLCSLKNNKTWAFAAWQEENAVTNAEDQQAGRPAMKPKACA